MSVFILIPKKDKTKKYSTYCKTAHISHVSKVRLIILQARLQLYMNRELKRCTSWVLKRQRSQRFNWQYGLDHGERKGIPEKSLHWLWWSLWLYWSQKNLWKILKEMGKPDHVPLFWETCTQVKKQQNQTWDNWLVQNWEESTTRLCIVTIF